MQQQNEREKDRMSKPAVLSLILTSLSVVSVFVLPQLSSVAVWVGYPTLVPILAIAGLFAGIGTLIKCTRDKDRSSNRTLAIGGIVLATIVLCLTPRLVITSVKHRKRVQQMSQFRYMDDRLEEFRGQRGAYPPSDAQDPAGSAYCGAMKLCEALWGRDFHGFHPESVFRSDGMDAAGGVRLYSKRPQRDNLADRIGPFLNDEDYRASRLGDLYANVGPFDGNDFVLCDVFRRVGNIENGKKAGMPILYFRADTSKTAHNIDNPDDPENIYDYKDNRALLALGVPSNQDKKHPLFREPKRFYEMTKDYGLNRTIKPQRADTFILLSAGYDGLYGTKDDVLNFEF